MTTRNWQQIAAEKRLQQELAITTITNILTPETEPDAKAWNSVKKVADIDDAVTLAGMLASGEVTSEGTTKAYILR